MKQAIRAGIIGITGYTGEELLKILMRHPRAAVTALQGRSASEVRALKDVYAHCAHLDLSVEALDTKKMAAACDVVFLALPHTVSFEIAPALVADGVKVIDLSADFRIADAATYEHWYAKTHTAQDLLPLSVYGLTELNRAKIAGAALVANPGCYPTSVILGAAPALAAPGLVDPSSIIVDAVSGISGAGRKSAATYFETEHPNFRPYNISGGHRHIPEMEQELTALAGSAVPLHMTFTPHIMPVERGMMSTIYLTLRAATTTGEVIALYKKAYAGEPFVRVLDEGQLPEVRHVAHTNMCEIGMKVDARTNRLVVVSAIDNLLKGASGQAVQNMNLMFGCPETDGLREIGE